MARDNWRYRYSLHKHNAKHRGILFRLTFDEWCSIWKQSRKWNQRGWRKGQYCMCRPGDRGAYEVGNVIICLASENRAERNHNYPLAGANNPAFGKDYFATWSKKKQAKRRRRTREQFLGKPKSDATLAAMSMTAMGRRRVIRNGHHAWAHPGDADFPRAP